MKCALITGITGQDGSYLAELLLEKGYEVHGLVRRVATEDHNHRFSRINHILNKVHLHGGTLESYPSIVNVVMEVKPDECYHLAAQSYVAFSFEDSFSTLNTNINGTHHMLEALRRYRPKCKFYFAASSEMFGKVRETPQNELTPFHPRSPYGISKVAGFDLTRNYRESYNMFCCSGILFNHESPRRGLEFVTRKITTAAVKIANGLASALRLGNLDAYRDWGHARDYVKAMWLMLQHDIPDDYVVATGVTHSVRDFVIATFEYLELNWRDYVSIDPKFYRPADVNLLLGNASKARNVLGWKPEISFIELVHEMTDYDAMKSNAA